MKKKKGGGLQTVITAEQAKKITGGRTPLVPIEYEEAVKALKACITLDEAKVWDNKADMLAAWAKIYHSNEAEVAAKRLKLHAYRRMGQLAEEIRPSRVRHRDGKFGPSIAAVLVESGLKKSQAQAAVFVGKLPSRTFDSVVASKTPAAPSVLLRSSAGSELWMKFSPSMQSFRAACRAHRALDVARGLTEREGSTARSLSSELQEWLDEFEQHLPKVKK